MKAWPVGAGLLLASCGLGPPNMDDGTYAAWTTSVMLTGSAKDVGVGIDWRAQPTFEDIKAAYPASAHGLISMALKCQIRRDRTSTACAFVGSDPDTDEVHRGGKALAQLFKVDPSALRSPDNSKPFADVSITICKRANPGVGEDECLAAAGGKKADYTLVPDEAAQ